MLNVPGQKIPVQAGVGSQQAAALGAVHPPAAKHVPIGVKEIRMRTTNGYVGHGVEPQTFRNTLGHFASGITVISGAQGSQPIGFTCQSFSSLSVEPPLICFNVMNTSTTYPLIRDTGRFAVNVLAAEQHEISNQFAMSGTDKWAGVDWRVSRQGNPVLMGSLMWLDCTLFAEHPAGDHLIVVGHVREMSPPEWHVGDPLLYFKGRYHRLGTHDG